MTKAQTSFTIFIRNPECHIDNSIITPKETEEAKQEAESPIWGNNTMLMAQLTIPPIIVFIEFIFVFPEAVITVEYNMEKEENTTPNSTKGTYQ